MKRVLSLGVALTVTAGLLFVLPTTVSANKSSLATITGTVNDQKGKPLADALVSLLKEGADEVIKQTRTDSDGKFRTRIAPGRYGIRAVAEGFSEVVFASVEVRASQELIYRFNLQAAGSGGTVPELRKDREDVKWTLRSTQTRRSIFQIQEGEEVALETSDDPEASSHAGSRTRTHGVVETYVATNAFGPSYPGLNFAVSTPATDDIELIFAGQTGLGSHAPERLEATARFRPDHRHRIGLTAGAIKFGQSSWNQYKDRLAGQFSVRAIDEWVVREHMDQVFDLSMAELRRVVRELIPEEELAVVKDQAISSTLLGLESSSARATALARQQMIHGRRIPPDEIIRSIKSVTPEAMQEVARTYFTSESLAVGALGNLNGFCVDRSRLEI